MPIKSLQINQTAQFPIIGKLRKGDVKQQKTSAEGKKYEVYGKDLDYFRFDSQDAAAVESFAKAYGDKPKSIRILLPFPTPDGNFQAWMEEYSAGGLQRRCDSEIQTFSREKDGKASASPKQCERLCGGKCGCKQVGRLYVIIPELARLAYVIVETHSVYDIIQLTQNLQAAHGVRGSLNGVPFLLTRRKKEISTPGDDGKRVRRVKNLLFLEPDPEWVQRKLLAMRNEAFALLPAQSSASHESMYTFVDGDTGEIVGDDLAGEFSEDGDNPFDGAPRQSPAIDRLINTIDKLFGAESASATTYLVVGWCRKNKTQIRSTIVELSDDECDSLADSLTANGEAIKAKYGIDKKAAEAGATTGK
jgi:uncharacterized membrane protein YuzA (DUF378 family)